MYKNYIFDLDGTLINSLDEVFRCFRAAFATADYPINENNLTENIIGPPLRDIVSLIAPELKDEKIIDSIVYNFSKEYDTSEQDCSFLYDGVKELLFDLKNNGCKIFMATYKLMKPSLRIVKHFEIDIFDEIYGIDKFGEHITKTQMINDIIGKYNLDKSETVMIGDSPSDVIAAKEAGITGIGVMWGYGSDKTNLINNSDRIINSIDELYQTLITK